MLELLGQVPAFVCYFYEEFRHAVTSYLPPLHAKSNTAEMAKVANLITLKDLSERTLIGPQTQSHGLRTANQSLFISATCGDFLKSTILTARARRRLFPPLAEA